MVFEDTRVCSEILLLLLAALCTGVLKSEAIADTANFLISVMPLRFVAPAVNILQYWGLISGHLIPICVITLVSTVAVFLISGVVTQKLLKKEGGKDAQ